MAVVSEMTGLFKEVYASKEERVVPIGETTCADMFSYVPAAQREGDKYVQPVILSRSHGVTFNTDGSAYSLNAAISPISQKAEVQGVNCLVRERVSYPAILKALKAQGAEKRRAFVSATQYAVESLLESAAFYREVQMLHGGGSGSEAANVGGIGLIDAQVTDNGTTQVYSIQAASWAPALWAGMLNARVDIHDAGTYATKNVNSATITAVDCENKQITLSGVEAELDTLASGDVIVFEDARAVEMAGLSRFITNTGTLHNIDASTYDLWGGNTLAAGSAAFTFAKLLSAVRLGVNKGLKEDACAIVSPATWDNLMNNLSALRRYSDKAGGSIEQGSKALTFFSQNGMVSVKPHLYCKEGEAFVGPHKRVKRVGASDITFTPDKEGEVFHHLSDAAGVELRVMWNQNLICSHPAQWTKVTGIVNS